MTVVRPMRCCSKLSEIQVLDREKIIIEILGISVPAVIKYRLISSGPKIYQIKKNEGIKEIIEMGNIYQRFRKRTMKILEFEP